MDYLVLRHGGRKKDAWREVYRGPQGQAEAKYTDLFKSMRPGGMRVALKDGTMIKQDVAPRVRARW